MIQLFFLFNSYLDCIKKVEIDRSQKDRNRRQVSTYETISATIALHNPNNPPAPMQSDLKGHCANPAPTVLIKHIRSDRTEPNDDRLSPQHARTNRAINGKKLPVNFRLIFRLIFLT
jgi:hypothetical protein